MLLVPTSLTERQLALELEAHETGVSRYRRGASRALEGGRATQAGPARWLLQQTVVPLAEAITAWRKSISGRHARRDGLAYTSLKPLKSEVAAALTARTVLDWLAEGGPQSYSTVANRVGRECLKEIQWAEYAKGHAAEFANFRTRLKHATESWRDSYFGRVVRDRGIEVTRWDRRTCAGAGAALVHLLIESTGMVAVHDEPMRKRRARRRVLSLRPEVLEWLERSAAQSEGLHPAELPMLVPPLPWGSPSDGGYLSNRLRRAPLVHAASRMTQHSDVSGEVLEAVNHLQDTAWRVNTDVLEVAQYLSEAGGGIAGLVPLENEPIPEIPDDEGTEEQRRDHARRVVEVRKLNRSRVSKRISMARTLAMAQRFRDEEALYYVQKLDFRGRAYPRTPLLQPQGDGLARGLLEFAEAAPVALGTPAADWLAVHGANCWGNDKVPFAERVGWAHDHTEQILEVYADPIENRWWAEADEPWGFLAWCLEWGRLIEEERIESRLPVAMDGSNNGLQIFSLLLRDEEGAEATNVIPSERPEDVYQRVADLAWAHVHRMADGYDGHSWGLNDAASISWLQWLGYGESDLPRSAVKRPVMVLPYGGTLHSCRQYLMDWAVAHDREHPSGWDRRVMWDRVLWLADLVWSAIGEVVPAAIRGMAWLHSVADVASEHGVALEWSAPTGFRVHQGYQKQRGRYLNTKAGFRIRVQYHDTEDAIDPKRQRNGVAPNFVHSLDAAAMARTVTYCREACIGSLSMVHDSFACHAADAELLARLLREAYVDVFTPDRLAELRDQILRQLPEGTELPPLPDYGNLNPRAVLDSPYFFA